MKNERQLKNLFNKINKVYECFKCPSLYSKFDVEEAVNRAKREIDEIRDDIMKEWNDVTLTKKLRDKSEKKM